MNVHTFFAAALTSLLCGVARGEKIDADDCCRPETWFHLIGGNISKEGIIADLDAIKYAGIRGIHLFHGSSKHGLWPGVKEPVECLSPKWDELVGFIANECGKRNLTFRMQNCPGWSMSGGPWIKPQDAMRELVFSATRVPAGTSIGLKSLPRSRMADDVPDRNYQDVAIIAFPAPLGSDGPLKPLSVSTNRNERIYRFGKPVVIRTLKIDSTSVLNHDRSYDPQCHVKFEARMPDGGWKCVAEEDMPPGNWQDNRMHPTRMRVMQTLACDEMSSCEWRLALKGKGLMRLRNVEFTERAMMDNWEGLAGWTVRGLVDRGKVRQSKAAWVDSSRIRDLTAFEGEWSGEGACDWIILRIGHVNALHKNGPAPEKATGWECTKLDQRGAEINFRAYIGRLLKGPLKGRMDGMVIDSWECYRQNWRDGMPKIFYAENGYRLETWLPAVFGYVIDSPEATWKFLLDWRRTIGGLVERNYYGRMAELAREHGIEIQFETAFGDALAGDILAYWKYADVPMCEFWHPPAEIGVGSMNFKPLRPCVSAAHLYGKKRIAAEAFTQAPLEFRSTFRDLKANSNRAFARGVTYLVFHTYTHNPQMGWKKPGSSFGNRIGTPFLRGQTWWKFMPEFTEYIARITKRLEAGRPVVDVLRYLGDGLGHHPDESGLFAGNMFKCDYLNNDVLMNRLSVKNGRIALPDGMSYSVLWIPERTYLLPESKKRISMLEAAGAKVVRGGSESDTVDGLAPDCRACGNGELLWYHRREGERDWYFIAAGSNGYSGKIDFRAKGPARVFDPVSGEYRKAPEDGDWRLAQNESLFVMFGEKDEIVPEKNMAKMEICRWDVKGEKSFNGMFELEEVPASLILDLGRVESWAEVTVNGCRMRGLWCYPYACDIAEACVKGKNSIRVESVSTWHNQLVKDAAKPEPERSTWTLYGPGAHEPLVPEGLFGPVTVLDASCRKPLPVRQ